ncbi:MAG: glycosyltransferase family 4 protein, partial [Candidatus Cloacimonetes bacterium]|nr:glycosyltransferase family 4 protein [Candidatus Cloacimonadota bacterium]
MKILVLTQHYPPDIGAASFRMESLVMTLLKRGHNVTVLTAQPNRYKELLHKDSVAEIPGLVIYRVKLPQQTSNFLKRSFVYLQYFLKSFLRGLRESKKSDVILATSPQLLVGYLGSILSKLRKKPFVLDIRDLWPDAMLDLQVTSEKSLLFKILKRVEKKMITRATRIVINSPAFEEHIKSIKDVPITIITNGLDDSFLSFFEMNKMDKKPKKPYKVLYTGNLGIAQDLDILTRVAKRFEGILEFELLGSGSQKELIANHIREGEISNILITQPVPRQEVLSKYLNADILFVHLKDIPMFKKTIPSKIFEYVASGKPVVYGLNG